MLALITLLAVLLCLAGVVFVALRPPASNDAAFSRRVDMLEASLRQLLAGELALAREEGRTSAAELRREVADAIRSGDESAIVKLTELSKTQQMQLQASASSTATAIAQLSESTDARLAALKEALSRALEATQNNLAAKHDQLRSEAAENRRAHREEITRGLQSFNDSLLASVAQHGSAQREDLERVRLQIQELSSANETRLEGVRKTVDERLQIIQNTVDERLQETLEKRLGDSFTRVAAQLEEVHKGLGEMRGLASNVTDLKKVFSNVKSRGGWGEVQLESILVDILTPDQYERNAVVREGTRESVEFAVKFPGKGDTPLLLPVDAKFPREDYDDLVDAYDRGEPEAVEAATRRLESTVRNAAKTIRDKYLNPPVTTEFAILFLPTEGLYAEVLRRPGLADFLQREHRVLIAGPTTLTAILTSLQMGFRTLAIEQRSSEVWRLLEAVKTEFGNFGNVVDKVDKTLTTARNHIELLRRRSRVLSKSLKNVDVLPEPEAKLLLKLAPDSAALDDTDDDAWVEATSTDGPEAEA